MDQTSYNKYCSLGRTHDTRSKNRHLIYYSCIWQWGILQRSDYWLTG